MCILCGIFKKKKKVQSNWFLYVPNKSSEVKSSRFPLTMENAKAK